MRAAQGPGKCGLTLRDPKKYTIIHADDVGLCRSVNQGTIQALETGLVSSCSMMIPCPYSAEFAAYAKDNPHVDVGIHLTLTSEWPSYRWSPVSERHHVPSLLDSDGYFWPTVGLLEAHTRIEDVERELRAQIDWAQNFGVTVSHLDQHMFALTGRLDFLELYVQLGVAYQIPAMLVRELPPNINGKLNILMQSNQRLLNLMEKHHLPIVDACEAPYQNDSPDQQRQRFKDIFQSLKPGITVILAHCGLDDDELNAMTLDASLRHADLLTLTDPVIADFVRKLDIEIINWQQCRQLTVH